jgi:hypothetical protein
MVTLLTLIIVFGFLYVGIPTLVHPNYEDLSLGTPKPQRQERGEGGAPNLVIVRGQMEYMVLGGAQTPAVENCCSFSFS